MEINKNIGWYLENPSRFILMKPFTRGGVSREHGFEHQSILSNTCIDTGVINLELQPVSQDIFLTEYDPNLHHIILNKAIPHIKVMIDKKELPMNMMEMTETASYQKLIHAAHVRSLTSNQLNFSLYPKDKDQNGVKLFGEYKSMWLWNNLDCELYEAIVTCKKVGNVGVLFRYNKEEGKCEIKVYSYEDGYQIVPNYDEFGNEVARSLVYKIEGKTVVDAYDRKYHYRCVMDDKDQKWTIETEVHGFSRCPLLYKRGKVAWEYAESSIEMLELMTNIHDIALKRFGTFGLVLIGDMDEDSFQRDSSTLIINLSSDTTNGRQDAKVLDFPEPQTMEQCLSRLKESIALYSSTSFITPKDITTTNSGGNGIALAMSNDFSLATQSAKDWKKFVNAMVQLYQEGIDLEEGGNNKFAKLRISAEIEPWFLETNNTKITNLQMESKHLSLRTIIEKSPDSAPDEIERIIKERGALVPQGSSSLEKEAEKAKNISQNRSNVIVDNNKKEGNINE